MERIENGDFHQFMSQFPDRQKKALELFYTQVVGHRNVLYKFKDRVFGINLMTTPAFMADMEFLDVLIEDGRHPKEVLFTNVKGFNLPDGRYMIQFVNGLNTEGQSVKESAFSFSGIKEDILLFDYNIQTFVPKDHMNKLQWRLFYEQIYNAVEKGEILGKDYMNNKEQVCFPLYRFFKPLIEMYLSDETVVGKGKSAVVINETALEEIVLRPEENQAVLSFFEKCEFEELVECLKNFEERKKRFVKVLFYLFCHKKGHKIFDNLKFLMDECVKGYAKVTDTILNYGTFRSMIMDTCNTLSAKYKWQGLFPNYRKVQEADFVEVSNVYEKKYTYINEKQKIRYLDFVESVVDGRYIVSVLEGMIIAKEALPEYRQQTSLDCCFREAGRRQCSILKEAFFDDTVPRAEMAAKVELMFRSLIQ